MTTYYLISTSEGCTINLTENATYSNYLNKKGFTRCDHPQNADILIINTCGYSTSMESRSAKIIQDLRGKYPNKKIVIGGCLPKINQDKVSNKPDDTFFAPGNVKELAQLVGIKDIESNSEALIANKFDLQDISKLTLQHKLIIFLRPLYYRIEKLVGRKFQPLHNILQTVIVNNSYHIISVGQGCRGKCTFCGIKNAKGDLRSKPLEQIKLEFQQGLDAGKRKFWLIADDIGCWGQDIKHNSADLLETLLNYQEDFQLVVTYFDPTWLIKYQDRLIRLFGDPRIINVSFPLQSGSLTILKKMARHHNPHQVGTLIKKIKILNPNIVIKTNIIIGFPGETWKDFIDSIKITKYFDALLALPYGIRPNTVAAKYPNHISPIIKFIRMLIINMTYMFWHIYVALKSIIRPTKY